MSKSISSLIYTEDDLRRLKDLIQKLISKYEDESGEFISGFYSFIDEIDDIEQLRLLLDRVF